MSDAPTRFDRVVLADPDDLRTAWETNAEAFIAWTRAPGHDSYWLFHRDAFLELVPPPGRLTVDVGCGEGRLSRDLEARGHRVVGIDASPTMVAAAHEADPSVDIRLGDAAALPLDTGCADLVVAFMSLQDIDDASAAIRQAARVLNPGGHLVVAIVHPFTSAGTFSSFDPDSPFVVEGSCVERRRYRDHVERDGLSVMFESEHRPIGWYVDRLASAGFLIERLREVPIPAHAVEAPRHRRWQRLPLFLHIRALRP